MGDPHSSKPGSRPGAGPSSAKAPAASGKSAAPTARPADKSGRIVHDDRGNAVWDWLKDTARTAIDSTSRLLRRLEVPELKMEDTHNEELRIESARDSGGGYNPYGGSTPGRTADAGGAGGGGYDPYGKGVTRKPTRKP